MVKTRYEAEAEGDGDVRAQGVRLKETDRQMALRLLALVLARGEAFCN